MKTNGQIGYEAYARVTRGKTFDGKDMPLWPSLPARIHAAWEGAAAAIVESAVERGRGLPNTADCAQ
jgi:hypothetical protein